MFKSLGQFVVRVANLAEAEGRVVRDEIVRLMKLFCVYGLVALFVFCGVFTIATGLYLIFCEVMHRGAALLLVGGIVVGGAAVLGYVGYQIESKHEEDSYEVSAE